MQKLKYLMIVLFLIFLSVIVGFIYSGQKQSKNERYVLATLYALVSGEFKALQLQAYNIGKIKIDEYLLKNELKGNEAVVVDIDETVLETFPFEAKMIIDNKVWPDGFQDYLQKEICPPVSGSLEFLKYVDSLGIKIFYVSNRTVAQIQTVMDNLKKYNFPQVNESHIFLKEKDSNKEPRRKIIEQNYNILLLFGDNLADFSNIFSVKTNEERNSLVLKNKKLFGNKFIILPNASYGDWEGLVYYNNWKLTPQQMDSLRKATLRRFVSF